MSYSWGAGRHPARAEGAPATRSAVEAARVVTPIRTAERSRPPAESVPGPVQPEHQLAAELAPMVDVWQRLLVEHVPDRSGRCRTCTKGGTGLPSTPWPCVIHGIADLARRRHDGERR